MNAYCKESENPFGYLLVDNKPDTPADKQVLGDLLSNCHVISSPATEKIIGLSK
jgi:hypothetical protein